MQSPVAMIGASLILLLHGTSVMADAPSSKNCRSNADVIGPCHWLRGRISLNQGSPDMVIWPIGTKHLLGVLPSEDEIVPAQVRELWSTLPEGSVIFGEFEVCPFTKAVFGEMQYVCIEISKSLSVRPYSCRKR